MKGFWMKRCLIKVLIQNLGTLMGSFMCKMCYYSSRLKKGTITKLKFSIKKDFPNIFLSPKILIRMESLCWQSVFLPLSHLSTSVVSFDKHCRLLIQKFQQFIFSCESGIWLQGISQGENKTFLKISENCDHEVKKRHNEISGRLFCKS